jgi:hypothetical protein
MEELRALVEIFSDSWGIRLGLSRWIEEFCGGKLFRGLDTTEPDQMFYQATSRVPDMANELPSI